MRGFGSRVVALLLLLWPSTVFAADPRLQVQQLRQTAWTTEDGAPSTTGTIAQTPDGFLWIAAVDGLHRFDGRRFERVARISRNSRFSTYVSNLLVTRAGTLWVGYASGGVAVWRDGRLIDMHLPNGADEITDMKEGADGAIWVSSGRQSQSVTRYLNGGWRAFGAADGLPDDWVMSILPARDGSIWLTNTTSLLVMRPGADRFVKTPERLLMGGQLAQDGSGAIWISADGGTRVLPDYVRHPNATPSMIAFPTPGPTSSGRLLFDRDGSLWVAIWERGVFRIRNPRALYALSARERAEAVEALVPTDGPIGDAIRMLEDREGNLWITSARERLIRLSAPKIVLETTIPVPASGPAGYQLAQGHRGEVYIADATALYRAPPGQAPGILAAGLDRPRLLCADRDDGLWYLNGERLYRNVLGRVSRPPPSVEDEAAIVTCIQDRDGRILFFGLDSKVRVLFRGGWQTIDLPEWRQVPITRVMYDRNGGIIAQRRGSPLISISGDRFRELYGPEAATIGSIGVYQDTEAGLLIGGESGVALLTDGSLINRRSDQHPWAGYTHGIGQSRDGFTWLWTGEGLVRMQSTRLNDFFTGPDRHPAYELFNRDDGLPSLTFGRRAGWPHMVQGGDGRLWLSTARGVAWVDPGRLARNPIAPALFFRSLSADGALVDQVITPALKAGVSGVQIDYGAASLTMPERVRYRYRLEGLEERWVDAGGRQQAFYTNLKPGHYVFHLMAANEDGVWSEARSLAFSIPPTFLQSRAFVAICVLLGLLLIWMLFNLRVRQVSERLNTRLAERLAERERIARELHDTLLQGFHGLMMHFQTVAESIPKRSPARAMMEEALDRADAVLIEGRDRVHDLRMQTAGGLASILAAAVDRLKLGDETVRITEEGEPRDLPAVVREEVSRVGEEALANALRHAQARNIDILIGYERRRLRLTVRDDGVGLDPAVAEAGHRPGHFGLVGMRERARALRGDFAVHSRPGGGVEVVLVVPANVAYGAADQWWGRLDLSAWRRRLKR